MWSERWSEKPEVCWFDSDLRHHLCSISLEVKRGVANAKSRVRVSYVAPYADMAQLVEHILGKDEVTSSNLVISSNTLATARVFFFKESLDSLIWLSW